MQVYIRDQWLAYDLLVTLLMLTAMALYIMFYIYSLAAVPLEFSIYDSKGASKARIFLPKKLDTLNSTSQSSNAWAAFPGGIGRWTLVTDNTGTGPQFKDMYGLSIRR